MSYIEDLCTVCDEGTLQAIHDECSWVFHALDVYENSDLQSLDEENGELRHENRRLLNALHEALKDVDALVECLGRIDEDEYREAHIRAQLIANYLRNTSRRE